MFNHIRVKRMWDYAQMRLELTLEELAHLSECASCRKLFQFCLLSDKPAIPAPTPQGEEKKKSA